MKQEFDFDLPLKRYFLKPVADDLSDRGISCLDDLLDRMYENPNGWWKELGLSKSRANGIISWMHARRNVGLELPDTVRKKAEDLGKRFYKNEEIEEVGGALWHDLILDRSGKRILGQPQKPNSEVQPLEHLSVPPQFDGSNGSNRGDKSECALDVDSDKEAVTLWLKAKATNANTLNAYRREGERFLLWCLLEKHIPLSSAKISECSDYLTWLQMLGRTDEQTWSQRWLQPQAVWLGPKNIPRDSRDWRPFNCALSFSSRKAASTIVRQLFTFLHKTGYLRFNPFDQISSKVQLLPGEGKPKEFADRSLTKEQWEEIEEYLDKQPDDILKARLKVMLLLGKGLGMRASEMLNARCGWIQIARYGQNEELVIDIVGKGDKERRLPISEAQERIINDYLAYRRRPLLLEEEGRDIPILASLRPGSKGAASEGLSRSGLYLILQKFLEEVAAALHKERPRDSAKLRASSLHWLRHTFAVTSLEVMPVNVVQNALGHASVNTTTKYIAPDQKEILESFKRLEKNQ